MIEEARRRANGLKKETERERERMKMMHDNNNNNPGGKEEGEEQGEEMRRGRQRHDDRGLMRRVGIPNTSPYPMRNLIPTETDFGALSGMILDN